VSEANAGVGVGEKIFSPHPDGSEFSFVAVDPPHQGEGNFEKCGSASEMTWA
jgi:hypothetical protein